METIDTGISSGQAHKMPPPHILLMEDEHSIANGLKMVLTEEGYAVDLAMTGQSALDSFFNNGFDLLVADLRLPDIDGFEVIKQVKAKRPETEVVVITGYSSVYSAVDAMKLGVYDYLPKPFTEDEIKRAVSGALENKKKAMEAKQAETAETQEEKLIQKREVTNVLNRTAEDEEFWTELMENGSEALQEYHLSSEAKAAIISGDLKWSNEHVGELTQKQLMFIFKRLEREVW
ncbi:MAG: response regulator [Desulfuromonadaceae bacterium]|nr:response regulator [Desulfuromonadaceae bacterium]